MSATIATLGITSRTAHEELEDYYQYEAGTPVDSNIPPIVLDVGALKSLLGSLPLVQHVLLHAEPQFYSYCGGRFSIGIQIKKDMHRPLSLALASLQRVGPLTVEAVNWTWNAGILAGYIRAGELSAASLPQLRNVCLSTCFGGPGRLAATMSLIPHLERVSLHLVLHEKDDDCTYASTVRAPQPGQTICAHQGLVLCSKDGGLQLLRSCRLGFAKTAARKTRGSGFAAEISSMAAPCAAKPLSLGGLG